MAIGKNKNSQNSVIFTRLLSQNMPLFAIFFGCIFDQKILKNRQIYINWVSLTLENTYKRCKRLSDAKMRYKNILL